MPHPMQDKPRPSSSSTMHRSSASPTEVSRHPKLHKRNPSPILRISHTDTLLFSIRPLLPISTYEGVVSATQFGNICIHQTLTVAPFPNVVPHLVAIPQGVTQSEDCFNFSVIVLMSVIPALSYPSLW
ncbi:hypothetical protein BC628DRAFT_1365672 [Trametes gibbosa]|nr:hypothetical protein BC628DRAFT_1365672 [Trametes gibbosa]